MRAMALDELYQRVILDHNRAPKNRRELPGATHRARGLDALCGDDLVIELAIDDERIEQAAWHGEACAVTTASASMLTDWLRGRQVGALAGDASRFRSLLEDPALPDVDEFKEINCLRAVSKFPSRVRNALLPWETALEAVRSPG
jgi:nitrogen fixation NifU-like protein